MLPPAKPSSRERVGQYARFALGGVLDAFALPVARGVFDEARCGGRHVGFVDDGCRLRVEVSPLLHEFEGLDDACGQLVVDVGLAFLEHLSAGPPTGLRLLTTGGDQRHLRTGTGAMAIAPITTNATPSPLLSVNQSRSPPTTINAMHTAA